MADRNLSDAPTPNSKRQSWTIQVPPLAPAPVTSNSTEAVATSSSSAKSPSTQPSPSSTQPPPTKRQKVSIACQECRTHKTKCDGVRPICGSCRKKKPEETSCSYNPERGKRGIKNQYVQLLEEKVKELEAAMGKPKNNESVVEQQQIINNEERAASSSPIALQRPQQLIHSDHLNIPNSPSDMAHNSHYQSRRYTEGNIPTVISDSESESWMKAQTNKASPLSQQKDEPTMETSSTTQQQPSSAIDAMGAITSDQDDKTSRIGDRSQGYFGLSSAGRFMKQVHDVIDKKSASYNYNNRGSLFSSASSQGSPTNSTAPYRDNNRPRAVEYNRNYSSDLLSNVVLPPRKVADGLVNNYWIYVHTLYPFLHKPSFMQTYSQLWGYPDHGTPNSNNSSSINYGNIEESHLYESESEPLFQCTLNLVFALGCQLSPDTHESEREASSDVFFQRSKKLLHFDILEAGNIKVVQALLLMGQYLQCTKLPGRCWIVVGLAIRVAQGLGLHLEGKSAHIPNVAVNQLDKELRKRLWGGCIVLDRFLSMAYGRPFMIPVTRDLKLPDIIDDEILTAPPHAPARQPEGKPSQMAFLVYTIKLYEIMGEILLTLYSDNSEGFSSTDNSRENGLSNAKSEIDEQNLARSLNSIIKLEMALNSWKQSLPVFLQHNYNRNGEISEDDVKARKLLRQCNVLKARYLHVCILLYRPLLVFYFTLEESNHPSMSGDIITDLQKALFIQSSKTCVTIAQDLIKTIKNNIKAQLPAWWYSIFYLYTAGTVLLMARLFPKIRNIIGEESLLSSWNECLECLNEYQPYGESAKKCYQYLSELDKHVWTATNNEQSNTASAMSSIQILGTLPQHNNLNTPHYGQNFGDNSTNLKGPNAMEFGQPVANNITEWDFDLQDISWLGRLPVYTDLESGYNMSANTWGNFGSL